MSTADEQFLGFIAERVNIAPTTRVRAVDLYHAYEAWAAEKQTDTMTNNAFGRKMAGHHIAPKRRLNSGNVYQGIQLR